MASLLQKSPLDVLIVDDSATYRMILTRLMKSVPDVTIVGTAPNGQVALEIARTRPLDLVLLDLSMPVLDGIETLRRLRSDSPSTDVVLISGRDGGNARLTMQALALGALDFIAKPDGADPAANFAALQSALQPILAAARRRKAQRSGSAEPRPSIVAASRPPLPAREDPVSARTAPAIARKPPIRIDVVALGVSTGGPRALQVLVPAIPADFPLPIVAVQHMPPLFTASLAERLDRESAIRVVEAQDGMSLEAGTFYLAPGGRHMVVQSAGHARILRLDDSPAINSCRPSVDVLFRSVESAWGGSVVTVVLTGMGADGAVGVEGIRARGGWSIVQDEASSVVWGMPGAIANAGNADEVLPLEQIAGRLSTLVQSRFRR